MKNFKIFIFIVFIQFVGTFAYAGSDGKIELSKKNNPENVKDCFEGVNRAVFSFNNGLDKVVFKPAAKGYRVLPSPVRTGTSNALNNLSNLITIPNNILQGDFKSAGTNSIRLVLNTTIGILGLFDPASALGYDKLDKEDYGQTLGTMGMGPGCYLVIPVLGPSTVRDSAGTMINFVGGDPWYTATQKNHNHYTQPSDYYFTKVLEGVDFRAKNLEAIDNLEQNSIDFYASVRSLYLQDRLKRISNSSEITESMDDSDWEEIDTK